MTYLTEVNEYINPPLVGLAHAQKWFDEKVLDADPAQLQTVAEEGFSSLEMQFFYNESFPGKKCSPEELREILSPIREWTRATFYERKAAPKEMSSPESRKQFDKHVVTVIGELLPISIAVAADPQFWRFVSCFILPDVVRWRWKIKVGAPIVKERFLGGRDRNAIGRLWWRQHLLTPELAASLGGEKADQILERPALASNQRLSMALGRCLGERPSMSEKKLCTLAIAQSALVDPKSFSDDELTRWVSELASSIEKGINLEQ
jgi:hypothetical protein